MANDTLPLIHIILTAFHNDFQKERDYFENLVFKEVNTWCKDNYYRAKLTHVRWGNQIDAKQVLNNALVYEKVIFINFTSEEIGLVPVLSEDISPLVLDDFRRQLSLTHEDIQLMRACYHASKYTSVVLYRRSDFWKFLVPEEQQFFLQPCLSDDSRAAACNALRKIPFDNVIRYNYLYCNFDWNTGAMDIQLNNNLKVQLLQWLQSNLRSLDISTDHFCSLPTGLSSHCLEQHSFVKIRSRLLIGRSDELKQLITYIKCSDDPTPMVLVGGAGFGKTSLMAKFTLQCIQQSLLLQTLRSPDGPRCTWPSANSHELFFHFVGPTVNSNGLLSTLQELLRCLTGVEQEPVRNLQAAVQRCYACLSSEKTRPCTIIIDGLDQFDIHDNPLICSWLPQKLPPKIKCVLSVTVDSYAHKCLMSREKPPVEVHLQPLALEDRKLLIHRLFNSAEMVLSPVQSALIFANKSSENPLWLTVAYEQLKNSLDYGGASCIGDFPDGLQSMFELSLRNVQNHRRSEYIVAALCLLEVSSNGLTVEELSSLLLTPNVLHRPSPYLEKSEVELPEKKSGAECPTILNGLQLTATGWIYDNPIQDAFKVLCPLVYCQHTQTNSFLRLYYPAMKKAVRNVFFTYAEAPDMEEEMFYEKFYRGCLVQYFKDVKHQVRRAKELLYQLSRLNDAVTLAEQLKTWEITELLFDEEFNADLLRYWRQVAEIEDIADGYRSMVHKLELANKNNEELLAVQLEKIARILVHGGCYSDGLDVAAEALKLEEQFLGGRAWRLVELYMLMADVHDEKLKLYDFSSPQQIPELKKTICYYRKSIELRKWQNGDNHKFKHGRCLMKLAFCLESWDSCGGDNTLQPAVAGLEANEKVDEALKIFKELGALGHYAEALMTKGVVACRGQKEQLTYYLEAMDLCQQVYGEFSILSSRLHINTGIAYEDQGDYVQAYKHFARWHQITEVLLGKEHPKTQRAGNILQEPRYCHVAKRLKELSSLLDMGNSAIDVSQIVNDEVEAMENGVTENNMVSLPVPAAQQTLNDYFQWLFGSTNQLRGVIESVRFEQCQTLAIGDVQEVPLADSDADTEVLDREGESTSETDQSHVEANSSCGCCGDVEEEENGDNEDSEGDEEEEEGEQEDDGVEEEYEGGYEEEEGEEDSDMSEEGTDDWNPLGSISSTSSDASRPFR